MYECPINIIMSDIETQFEQEVLKAVQQYDISVDKDELVKALNYDRQQYEKGYADAKAEPQWISCKDRLPENGRQVLVYARSVHYALAKYDEMREADGIYKKQWVTFDAWKPFYTIKDVLAWKPLDKPWEGEKHEADYRKE